MENMGLLIEVCSLDDIAQATYDLYNLYSGKQGETAEITVRLNTRGLMDATYRMRYTFFVKNSFGVGLTIDWVDGLCFDKVTTNDGKRLNWQVKQWGYIRMPIPEVLNESDNIYVE